MQTGSHSLRSPWHIRAFFFTSSRHVCMGLKRFPFLVSRFRMLPFSTPPSNLLWQLMVAGSTYRAQSLILLSPGEEWHCLEHYMIKLRPDVMRSRTRAVHCSELVLKDRGETPEYSQVIFSACWSQEES